MSNVRRAVEPDLALASQKLPGRGVLLAAALALGLFFIILLTLSLAKNSSMAVLLLDYSDNSAFTYPFSIQNLMHLMFFISLGELFVRWKGGVLRNGFLRKRYLPEDEETVLQAQDLGPIRKSVAGNFDGDNGFLPPSSTCRFCNSRRVAQWIRWSAS